MGTVDFDRDGCVGTITISDPPHNRLSSNMIDEFTPIVDAVEDADVRALVIRGAGDNFSVGGDLFGWHETGLDPKQITSYLSGLNRLFQQIENLAIPVIAAVRGLCTGGGLELAMHCDLIVAARDAQIRFPETTVAIPPLAGGVQRFAERTGRAQAGRMALLSDIIDGEEAYRLGLVARLAAADEVFDVADELATALSRGATLAFAATKTLLKGWSDGGLGTADRLMLDIGRAAMESEDFTRGLSCTVDASRRGVGQPDLTFCGE
jgi:enoyl-CoA hydratase/carnithine racemase